MSTDFVWKSYELYAKAFQSFWNFPVEWNPNSRQYEYTDLRHRKLRTWKAISTSTVIVGLAASVFGLAKEMFTRSVFSANPTQFSLYWVTSLGICVCAGFYSVAILFMQICGQESVSGMNEFLKFEAELKKKLINPGPRRRFDIVGFLMYGMVFKLAAIPYFLTLLSFFRLISSFSQKSDHPSLLQNIVSMMYPESSRTNTLIQVIVISLRLVLIFTASFDICRIICLVLLTITSGLIMLRFCISQLNRFRQDLLTLGLGIQYLSRLSIILSAGRLSMSNATAGMMTVGFWLSVLCNFASIRMHSIIPMPLYLLFPSVAVFIPMVSSATLPQAIHVHEASTKLLRKWMISSGRLPLYRKYLKRKIRSIIPLAFYAAIWDYNLFMMVRSTKGTFYWAITDYTINALLSRGV